MRTTRRPYPATVPLKEFKRFVAIVRRLREECPWDRKQTHRSLRGSLLEETYEVIDALDRNDTSSLRQELGDLMLNVAMHAVIAEQAGEFTLEEVLTLISDKLVRRHPHVFGPTRLRGAGAVLRKWERLKMKEGRRSVLEGVPRSMPALLRALRVQERASHVGFDWKDTKDVWRKIREEVEEVRRAKPGRRREEEFGDLFFSLVNYARFFGVNPEHALRGTVDRFTGRFAHIERSLASRGRDIHDATLEEMNAFWNEAKRKRPGRRG